MIAVQSTGHDLAAEVWTRAQGVNGCRSGSVSSVAGQVHGRGDPNILMRRVLVTGVAMVDAAGFVPELASAAVRRA
jgi:hypothetical protein